MTLTLSKKMAAFTGDLTPGENNFQKKAFERLLELDFPTTRDEYWKYTRLGKISNSKFQIQSGSNSALDLSEYIVSADYMVIENGVLRKDLSNYSNSDFEISFKSGEDFDSDPSSNEVFDLINDSFFNEVISIEAASGAIIETPLQLIFVGNGDTVMSNHRVQISVGKSSDSTVIYTYVSTDENAQFDNSVSEIDVAENAQFKLHKIQAGNAAGLSVSREEARQDKNSVFKINTFTFSGLLQRNNINIAVNGENCETHMNGAVVTKGKHHVDNHTFVDHKVSNCFSNENYKYVLGDQSTGVFNGRVVVRQDAQVINAYQNNGNILLSDDASINSKPELEIYADDVKCSHGSTTGQLDEDALFYLQTRGISKDNAKKLLVSAFIGEVIEAVENENTVDLIERLLKKEHGWDLS